MFFTLQEKTLPRHTVSWCVSQARGILKQHHVNKVCVNYLTSSQFADWGGDRFIYNNKLLTTQEASKVIEEIVNDTIFYEIPI